MDNATIAAAFREIALRLELKGESPFQVRAYRKAADQIAGADDAASLAREGKLTDLPGIGRTMADKIGYLLATGTAPILEKLREEVPDSLVEMTRIPGLGPGRIRTLREEIDAQSIDDVAGALAEGRLAAVKGFGPKTIADLERAIEHWRGNRSLRLHRIAREEAETIEETLRAAGASEVAIAGEIRRWIEVIGEIVLVAAGDDPEALRSAACSTFDDAEAEGDTIRFESPGGLPVRVRIAPPARFGAILACETGSAAHLSEVARIAESRGFRFDRDGLRDEAGTVVDTSDESTFYARLGLLTVSPEVREDGEEVELAASGTIPTLIVRDDILGAVHVHTTWSDGTKSLRAMAEHARTAGFRYIGIADHSRSAGYAGGLSAERLLAQGDEVRALNEELAPFRIFHGVESDILVDGSLDYEEEVLDKLDFVVASIHSRFGLSREEQTARLVAAIRNRYTTVLGHPSGRLLLTRRPYDFDPEPVWDAAKETGTAIELNAHEERLDVDWRQIGGLRDRDVDLWIGCDAHDFRGIEDLDLAVHAARKGWLGPCRIWNTLPADEFAKRITAKREG